MHVPPERQGEEKLDDYVFRIVLVEPGERTLGFLRRQVAPRWVRRLFDLAPEDSGIAGIYFFNVGLATPRIGRRREHPMSDLVHEEIVTVPQPDGRFDFGHRLARPMPTLAVWISSDGDDSNSHFTVLIEKIEFILAADSVF